MPQTSSSIREVLNRYQKELLSDWTAEQLASDNFRRDLITEQDLRRESAEFLKLLRDALDSGDSANIDAKEWTPVRDMLASMSLVRAQRGFTPSETASFVFSLKRPLFLHLQQLSNGDPKVFAAEVWLANHLLDRLGLFTTEIYQKGRNEVILRQQQELLELSTPVIQLWTGVLALPLIGTLDSARTQVVMESLLQEIVRTGSTLAIIDITGVPAVDTLVAQHLLKTVSAARLMGADCIISGIRPQIAQTIVHLGVELTGVTSKATLADAFREALMRLELAVVPAPGRA